MSWPRRAGAATLLPAVPAPDGGPGDAARLDRTVQRARRTAIVTEQV